VQSEGQLKRLSNLVIKAIVAVAMALLCAVAPLAALVPIGAVQAQLPVIMLMLFCYLGKLLIDTLFYDHYRP
jgi:hypothetical protein